MKSILTLVLFLVSVQVLAQTYPITSITIVLPASPDANILNWGSGASMFTITATAKPVNGRIDGRVQESKILVTIKKGGTRICGAYTSNSAPASNFNSINKVWNGNNAVSLLGKGCALQPGDYEICVQFFDNDARGVAPLSEEKCKTFSIPGKDQQTNQPPTTETRVNRIPIRDTEPRSTTILRETPVIPNIQESVSCTCGRWNPIVVNKVKYDCGSSIPGNCNQRFQFSTSYQCSPADESCQARTTWEIKKDGVIIKTGTGTNNINDAFTPAGNGTYTITLNAVCNDKKCPPCTYTIVVIDCGGGGGVEMCDCGRWNQIVVDKVKYDCGGKIAWRCNQPFRFECSYHCSPNNESCQAKTSWDITKDGVVITKGSGTNNISDGFIPTSNGAYIITLNATCNGIKCQPCTYTILIEDCIIITGDPLRYCNPCKDRSTMFGAATVPNITYQNNGSVAVNSIVTYTPNKVVKVTAEIVDVERMGERGCLRCTKESREFGNFTGGSLNSYAGNIINGASGYGKQIQWQYTSPTLINNLSYDLQMMFPPLTEAACCKDSLRICTRWTFTDEKCITCDTLICSIITREYKQPDGLVLSATFKNAAQIGKMGEPFISWYKQASDDLPKDFEEQSKKLYDQRKEKEIEFPAFLESIKIVFYGIRQLQISPIVPHQLLNTMCGNGNFEDGIIDPFEWQGAVATLYTNPPCWSCPNNLYTPWVSGIFPANGIPVNSSVGVASNHHTIVNAGPDPNFPLLLNTVPNYPSGNQYSLRLGNSVANFGAEKIEKTFVVPSSNNILTFWYASVFYDANHENLEPGGAPSFSVRVYDATNTLVPNLVYLDPSNTPKDKIIANLPNPFFINAGYNVYNAVTVIRQWTCAKIDLSALANQKVRVEFINTDCGSGSHYGYTYLDNFCLGCEGNPSGNVTIQPINSCVKQGTQICVNYSLPKVGTTTGSGTIKLQFYSNGNPIPYSITSSGLSTPTGTYCFTIDPSQLPCVNGIGGFDVTATGNFNMTVGNKTTAVTVTTPGIIGIPNNVQGIKPGLNNDLLCCINQVDNCCTDFVKKVTAVVSMVGNATAGYNSIKFTPTFNVGPKLIKQVRISVVNFETSSTNKECLSCESNTARYGTISVPHGIGGGGGKDAIEGMVYPTKSISQLCFPIPCPAWNTLPSSEVTWGSNSGPGYNLMDGIGDQSTSFAISLPKRSTLSCCDDTIKVCIKYSFTDVECKTCDTIICYKVVNRNTIITTAAKGVLARSGNNVSEGEK